MSSSLKCDLCEVSRSMEFRVVDGGVERCDFFAHEECIRNFMALYPAVLERNPQRAQSLEGMEEQWLYRRLMHVKMGEESMEEFLETDPLIQAARKGDLRAIEILLAASPTAARIDRAIASAVREGRQKTVGLLVKNSGYESKMFLELALKREDAEAVLALRKELPSDVLKEVNWDRVSSRDLKANLQKKGSLRPLNGNL